MQAFKLRYAQRVNELMGWKAGQKTTTLMHIDFENLEVNTESDVEQKIIMPLLAGESSLGIPNDRIYTKKYLAPTILDKRAEMGGGYYPDYSIWSHSFIVMIVEAKAPGIPSEVGYREASLYARHINQSYPSGLNPCYFILATNGKTLLYGAWDSEPIFSAEINDLRPASNALAQLQGKCHYRVLEAHARECLGKVRVEKYTRPYSLAGGLAILNAKLPVNRFAADLSPILRLYFSSSGQENITEIVERAYVSSAEVTEYDHVLEALLKDHLTTRRGTIVQELNPGRHSEDHVAHAIQEFDEARPQTGQLQIVQGAVGSGKSLFVRRYQAVLQSPDLQARTRWAFVDFNSSPPSLSNAEEWLCRAFIEDFQQQNPSLDFGSPEVLRGVFSRNIQRRKPIYDEYARASQEKVSIARADDLKAWQDNAREFAHGIGDYVLGSRREILLTVMDNVDRLDLENQLQAFQLALWFMKETHCFVILQMRDETYERYKNTPPLDAYRTGITFHITPPRFVDVVKRRLELSLEAISKPSVRRS